MSEIDRILEAEQDSSLWAAKEHFTLARKSSKQTVGVSAARPDQLATHASRNSFAIPVVSQGQAGCAISQLLSTQYKLGIHWMAVQLTLRPNSSGQLMPLLAIIRILYTINECEIDH